MDRDDMLAAAKSRGIRGAHLMKDDTLAERLADASGADAMADAGEVLCVVIAENVWIGDVGPRSERRKVKGDKVSLPRDLAQHLAARNDVVMV